MSNGAAVQALKVRRCKSLRVHQHKTTDASASEHLNRERSGPTASLQCLNFSCQAADTAQFSPRRWLENLHFTGDVDAMPEGAVFFADEPILRVTAPLPQAQFVETRIINLLNFQTVVASKAARSVLVAREKALVDFGLRRAHGAEAGIMAARASYIAGFSGTSNVLAGQRFNIPISGTMAHSFVQAHDDEISAFARFADANPGNVVLLIDTYETEAAAEKVVALAPKLKQRGIDIQGVRTDKHALPL